MTHAVSAAPVRDERGSSRDILRYVTTSFGAGKRTLAAAALLLLAAGRATGEDLSPLRGAAHVVSRMSYISWDNAEGWVELEDRQTIIEDFGADRRILRRELKYGESTLETTTFLYSSEGLQKVTVDGSGALLRRAEVTNSGGRTIERVYDPKGALLFSNVLRMDPGGRIIEAERRDADDVFVYLVRYLYDAKGNMLEAACLNPDGSAAFVSSFTYSDFDLRGAWRTRHESCSFDGVKNRPRAVIRRSIGAGSAD